MHLVRIGSQIRLDNTNELHALRETTAIENDGRNIGTSSAYTVAQDRQRVIVLALDLNSANTPDVPLLINVMQFFILGGIQHRLEVPSRLHHAKDATHGKIRSVD